MIRNQRLNFCLCLEIDQKNRKITSNIPNCGFIVANAIMAPDSSSSPFWYASIPIQRNKPEMAEIAARHAFGSRLRLTAVVRNDFSFGHCEAIHLSFMAVAISYFEGGVNTPFRYFPQKHKKQKPLIDFKGFYVLGGVLRRVSSPPQIKRRLLRLRFAASTYCGRSQ